MSFSTEVRLAPVFNSLSKDAIAAAGPLQNQEMRRSVVGWKEGKD